MKVFRIEKKAVFSAKFSFYGFLVFSAISIVGVFNAAYSEAENDIVFLISVIIALFFITLSAVSWRTLKVLSISDIAIDEEGIWYVHLGKENGLVFWNKVRSIKERFFTERLDLLDSNNQVLISVENQLQGFATLYEEINNRINTAG